MERYHGLFHLLFGLVSLFLVSYLYSFSITPSLTFVAILASFFPDLDHFLFYYTYGRHTRYAQTAGQLFLKLKFREYYTYVTTNHKSNHYILSHNLGTPILCLIFGLAALSPTWKVIWFAFVFHFLFDILEDYLAKGKLNPNWFFRFSSKGL